MIATERSVLCGCMWRYQCKNTGVLLLDVLKLTQQEQPSCQCSQHGRYLPAFDTRNKMESRFRQSSVLSYLPVRISEDDIITQLVCHVQ